MELWFRVAIESRCVCRKGKMASGNEFGLSRRDALISASASAALAAAPSSAAPRPTPTSVGSPPSMHKISLKVNGDTHLLDLDTRTTLLDALREHLKLTGTKKDRKRDV